MHRTPGRSSRWWLAGLLLLALGCSHDTSRDNPLDPQLTPPVEDVTVTVDEATGTATVQWSPYAGEQPFAAYWVLRREAELVKVDTVRILDVHQATFQDTTLEPDAEYLYWVAVVNRAGFVQERQTKVPVISFSVRWEARLAADPDSLRGVVRLRWDQDRGARFGRYEVWRRGLGGEASDSLATVIDPADTTWVDTTAIPNTDYLYRVTAFAAGRERSSEEVHGRWELPPVALERAEFDYRTATADLSWTEYQGPGFEAYEVRRYVPGHEVESVKVLTGITSTTCRDSLLHGNTEYHYRIHVRTTWEGRSASSNERMGRFYALEETIPVDPGVVNFGPQAVGLALGEDDRLYLAMTILSFGGVATRDSLEIAVLPRQGVRSQFTYPLGARPHLESPIRMAAGRGRVYVSVASDRDSILVAALDESGAQAWRSWVPAAGAFPVGLHVESNGGLLMVDSSGRCYRFRADGDREELELADSLPQPLRQVVVGPGVSRDGDDQFFLLMSAPQAHGHSILARTWIEPYFYMAGTLDDGTGLEPGETFHPVTMAFGERSAFLLVLEEHGRLQVFDVRPGAPQRYVTQWGSGGVGPGEFMVPRPISAAMEVGSSGRIYVADMMGKGVQDRYVRIQVFVP